MSNKKDYTRFSRPETAVSEPVVEQVVESVIESVEEVKVPEVEPTIGIVTDCVRLNVREDAESNAPIVGTINAQTELVIDMAESTNDFYKVITSAGIEGYCMKRFITIMP